MKKIFTLIALMVVLQTATKAQGNLQFNRVVSYTGSGSGYGYVTIVLDTVKQGKVIKLESIGISNSGNYGYGYLKINGRIYANISNNNSYAIHEIIWLKEGDIISYAAYADYVITGIEYNIVP